MWLPSLSFGPQPCNPSYRGREPKAIIMTIINCNYSRRQLDIISVIIFSHEVGTTKKLLINLNFFHRPLKIYRFH
jgi:hypothetical protein